MELVRHPGYVGYCITTLATQLAMGTLWGLIFAILIVAIFIYRTFMEDKTLHEELPGYTDYEEKVKYRMIPYIW
jgi:protein-S-isoprenylcysteine O-methyltransferase Ste14